MRPRSSRSVLRPSLPGGVRIVTSPSRRARETATILAMRAAPAVLEADPRWLEADVGDCEGLTFDEVEAASPGFAARLAAGEADIDWPGGETASALLARVTAAWEAILDDGSADGRRLAFGSHPPRDRARDRPVDRRGRVPRSGGVADGRGPDRPAGDGRRPRRLMMSPCASRTSLSNGISRAGSSPSGTSWAPRMSRPGRWPTSSPSPTTSRARSGRISASATRNRPAIRSSAARSRRSTRRSSPTTS